MKSIRTHNHNQIKKVFVVEKTVQKGKWTLSIGIENYSIFTCQIHIEHKLTDFSINYQVKNKLFLVWNTHFIKTAIV